MHVPKVSVCVPVYNAEKHIAECVRTLFEQTLDNIEYIFVDDGSRDQSIHVLENVLNDYPDRKNFVKVIRHPTNKGTSGARNTALKHVTGEYVIHCDADDWVELDMYEKLYALASKNDADLCYSPRHFCNNERDTKKIITDLSVPTKEKIIQGIWCLDLDASLWAHLWRREIAVDNRLNCPDHIRMGEDLRRTFQMLMLTKKIVICNEQLYHYRMNPNSVTHKFEKSHDMDEIENINFYSTFIPQIVGEKDFQRGLRRTLFQFIFHNALSSIEWYRLWWKAKLDIWTDNRYSFRLKLIFFVAIFFYKPVAAIWKIMRDSKRFGRCVCLMKF